MANLDYKQKASHDYNQLFQTISGLRLGYAAMEEAFRRMAFNVMAANCDDHTKNVSFLLREGENWALAPAYDMTHAHNPVGDWTNQHLMAVNGKFEGISRADLLAVADRFGIGTANKVLQKVAEAVAAWPDFAAKAGVSSDESNRIRGHHHIL
jgi:serine/threonine-protein kinase HipA